MRPPPRWVKQPPYSKKLSPAADAFVHRLPPSGTPAAADTSQRGRWRSAARNRTFCAVGSTEGPPLCHVPKFSICGAELCIYVKNFGITCLLLSKGICSAITAPVGFAVCRENAEQARGGLNRLTAKPTVLRLSSCASAASPRSAHGFIRRL
jgi:hypothetical protein